MFILNAWWNFVSATFLRCMIVICRMACFRNHTRDVNVNHEHACQVFGILLNRLVCYSTVFGIAKIPNYERFYFVRFYSIDNRCCRSLSYSPHLKPHWLIFLYYFNVTLKLVLLVMLLGIRSKNWLYFHFTFQKTH